ncbi:MAG: VOC family protein [Suipraeoptans sp.]
MKISRIAHTAYKVTNMDKSIQFYCDCLGLKKKFELLDNTSHPWIEYLEVAPMQYIELFYDFENLKKSPQDDNHIGYLHLSLEVDDIQAAKKEFEKKGVEIVEDIKLGPDYTYQMWIADPDGNRIELMEYTDNSLQKRNNK